MRIKTLLGLLISIFLVGCFSARTSSGSKLVPRKKQKHEKLFSASINESKPRKIEILPGDTLDSLNVQDSIALPQDSLAIDTINKTEEKEKKCYSMILTNGSIISIRSSEMKGEYYYFQPCSGNTSIKQRVHKNQVSAISLNDETSQELSDSLKTSKSRSSQVKSTTKKKMTYEANSDKIKKKLNRYLFFQILSIAISPVVIVAIPAFIAMFIYTIRLRNSKDFYFMSTKWQRWLNFSYYFYLVSLILGLALLAFIILIFFIFW